jgi:hypothetical protein
MIIDSLDTYDRTSQVGTNKGNATLAMSVQGWNPQKMN